MRFTIVTALAALAHADANADASKAALGAALHDCLAWKAVTGFEKVSAGTWVADGKAEYGLDKYKVVSDNSEVTEAMWKTLDGYNTDGCAEADALNDGAAYLAAGAVIAAATALVF